MGNAELKKQNEELNEKVTQLQNDNRDRQEDQKKEFEKMLKEINDRNDKAIAEQQKIYQKLIDEQRRKEKEEKNEYMKNYENMLKEINEKNDKAKAEQEKRYKELIDEQRRKEEEMRKQWKEAKDEEERKRKEEELKKLKEREEKADKALNKFRREKKIIIDENFEKIKEKFTDDKDKFCKNQIEKFDLNQIEIMVNSFERTENINDILEERIKKFTKEYLEGKNEIKHLNIVLVGPSGVGKSTLINSVLELEQNKGAKEGEAEPCTMGTPQYYESNKINFIRVADSRGIEKSQEYGVDQVVKDVKDFVEGKLLTKDPDKFVHCIWYCITGARFEDVERESLITLAKIYDNNKLPIIVVYTKAMMPALYKPIERKIKDLNLNLEFVPVISKDIIIEKEVEEEENSDEEEESSKNKKKSIKETVRKKGIKKLMDLSVKKAEDAVQSACYTGIKNNIKDAVTKSNTIQNERLELYVKYESKKKIKNFKEGMELSEMVESISDLIRKVIEDYLYDGKNKSLKKDSCDKIEDFLREFFKVNLKEYKDNFENFIDENSNNIAKILKDKQTFINNENNGLLALKLIETEEEFKNQFKKKLLELKPKAELYCLENCASYISEPIRQSFSNLLLNLFENCLNNENSKILFEDGARKMFENLKIFFDKFHSKKNDNKKDNNKKIDEK